MRRWLWIGLAGVFAGACAPSEADEPKGEGETVESEAGRQVSAARKLEPGLDQARVRDATKGVQVVKSAVNMYRLDNPGACPSADVLVEGKYLRGPRDSVDPWGNEWSIECAGGGVQVASPGPDGAIGTADDVRD